MKKILLLSLVVLGATFNTKAQEACEELPQICEKSLAPTLEDPSLYISDGQVYRAFIDEGQEAEFSATLYGGSRYRIAATAGSKDNYVIFEIRDIDGEVLFSNVDHANAPYWDFEIQNDIECFIVMKLDEDKRDSGCATMLIGFKK